MPYNPEQLERQAVVLKRLLRARIQSPSSPAKAALDQLIKGCEMAFNRGVLLAQENLHLRATIDE
jgi:hypothetical protein